MQADKITYLDKKTPEAPASGAPVAKSSPLAALGRGYFLAIAALAVCFALPLFRLARFALKDELYSYILLLPFVSAYLVYMKPPRAVAESKPWRGAGVLLILAGAALGISYYLATRSASRPAIEDYLAANMLAFFLCFLGLSFFLLGRKTLCAFAYPIGILVFMIPMPVAMRDGIQTFLQYGSAYAADAMFQLTGAVFYRDNLTLHLKGINILVAPECSGIHSSWILLITSILAGYLFLRSPWRRLWLTLSVLPLALLRNGFRVFTLGEISVHITPKVMDSPLHHQGGPLFFVLSLIPFFLFLTWLSRSERAKKPAELPK